jgi:hypothetical protein
MMQVEMMRRRRKRRKRRRLLILRRHLKKVSLHPSVLTCFSCNNHEESVSLAR